MAALHLLAKLRSGSFKFNLIARELALELFQTPSSGTWGIPSPTPPVGSLIPCLLTGCFAELRPSSGTGSNCGVLPLRVSRLRQNGVC
eukprot:6470190-Amphidinium_carterae.1